MSAPVHVDLGAVLPIKVRRVVYVSFILLYVVAQAIAAALEVDPQWLVVASRVIDYLSPLVVALAAVNVPTAPVVSATSATLVAGPRRALEDVDPEG